MEKISIFIKNISKKQLILIGVGVLALGGLVYSFTKDPVLTLVKAEIGSLEEEVLVTGKTRSAEEIDLGFEGSGKVVRVSGRVGSHVFSGDTLAVLDQSSLLADLRKAEANLNEEIVRLDSTKRSTGLKYEDAYNEAFNELKDAYASADNAVHNNADRFFTNPRTPSVEFNLKFNDGVTTFYFNIPTSDAERLETERVALEDELNDWNRELDALNSGDDLKQSYIIAEKKLNLIRNFLTLLASAINSLTTDEFEHQATLQGYRTSVAESRIEISTALSNLLIARNDLNSAPTAATTNGDRNYDDVRAGEARVESLRANVASIRADINKTILRSPISGTITRADAKVGEIVSSGESLISVISDRKLEIEANISEVNIGKVKTGNLVSITFDAFPANIFMGTVSYIDPGETVIDGVPTYKVTISFNDEIPNDVRSGLTANLRIETAKKDSVIKIPRYAVQNKSDASFVVVLVKGREEDREITTGLIGKDGTIEIISGLSEGEEVVAKTD